MSSIIVINIKSLQYYVYTVNIIVSVNISRLTKSELTSIQKKSSSVHESCTVNWDKAQFVFIFQL